jgi:membrane protein implicated in regulation of membrane protease activity
MKVDSIFGILLYAALIIALIVFVPWLGVWALNTLFPSLAIPYTLETWAAALIIKGYFTINVKKKD